MMKITTLSKNMEFGNIISNANLSKFCNFTTSKKID